MKTLWIAALGVIAPLLTSGCGTIANLRSGDPEVYGGVAKDVEFMMTPQTLGGEGDSAVLMLMAGEVGLSLVGDTLTLPLVICKRRIDDGYMDKTTSSSSEERGATSPHARRRFLRRSRRAAGSEKEETASPSLENVSLGKPQPLEQPAQPHD